MYTKSTHQTSKGKTLKEKPQKKRKKKVILNSTCNSKFLPRKQSPATRWVHVCVILQHN